MTDALSDIPSDEELLKIVKEILVLTLDEDVTSSINIDEIDLGTPILSLPLDSVSLMVMMSKLEDRLRVFIPDSKAFGFERVGDVTAYLSERLASKGSQ